jgi:hypothetical protein
MSIEPSGVRIAPPAGCNVPGLYDSSKTVRRTLHAAGVRLDITRISINIASPRWGSCESADWDPARVHILFVRASVHKRCRKPSSSVPLFAS